MFSKDGKKIFNMYEYIGMYTYLYDDFINEIERVWTEGLVPSTCANKSIYLYYTYMYREGIVDLILCFVLEEQVFS